ncbi:MAG: PEP-CTERM sorting domain-containing protein [Akkermansia sp.]|nr:PEP-CTERM sorting domain-containing protein [Akkermansia sp.]
MKKTLIALMALASFAAAETYTASTPAKSGSGAQGNYYGFTLSFDNAAFLTTDVPSDTGLVLDSITLQTRSGYATTDAMQVAVYKYTGDGTTGAFLGVSSTTLQDVAVDSTYTLNFEGIMVNSSERYQFLYVEADTKEDLSYFDGYKAASMAWGTAVTNSFSGQIPSGWGTYKGNALNSWEGMYMPVTTITLSSPAVPEPTSASLSLLALAGLAARRRRK